MASNPDVPTPGIWMSSARASRELQGLCCRKGQDRTWVVVVGLVFEMAFRRMARGQTLSSRATSTDGLPSFSSWTSSSRRTETASNRHLCFLKNNSIFWFDIFSLLSSAANGQADLGNNLTGCVLVTEYLSIFNSPFKQIFNLDPFV